ncbi:MAG: uroporphyrinogen decarboxylase [Halobacteriaceae archaeon]
MKDLFLRAANGKPTSRPPVWLMRQAGRYIPQYREIRENYTFKEAIKSPDVAEEITLLPWNRFQPDGIVMYSDILTVLEPLGFEYHLEAGTGPVIENPVSSPAEVDRSYENIAEELAYVGELLSRLDTSVGEKAAIIGFAGGPFTLASYATQGEGSRNHMALRKLRAQYPDAFQTLLESFADIVSEYLHYQSEMGADVVQLFDTYASILSRSDYEEFLLPLHQQILANIDIPTIIFVRGMENRLDLLKASGADVISIDWTIDMKTARETLGSIPVQGNLDPSYLFGPENMIRKETQKIIEAAGPRGHILNLGHGVHKDTPISGVETFVETAKEVSRTT